MTADETRPNRAASTRARREKRYRRVVSQPNPDQAAPVRKTAHGAPVLMRGVHMEIPTRPWKPNSMRRRFDISLRSPGAELRLPAVPVIRPNWRWLSGLLTAGLLALLGSMWSHPLFLVEAIEVNGLQRLEAREVNLVLGIQRSPIFLLDPVEMEYELRAAFPEFSDVQVGVGLPNAVYITVTERQPVLGWLNEQGLVLLDAGGVSFPARGLVADQDQGQRLPVVEAPDMVMVVDDQAVATQPLNPYVGRQILSPAQVEAIVQLSQAAPANAVLIYEPARGMGWEDPAGWVVFFGIEGTDIPAKLQMITSIVADLRERGITPAMISVEYLHAPYYRMER